MRAKAKRYAGGFKLVIDVPDPEPIPDGYRFVGWEFSSVEITDELDRRHGPDELTKALRSMLYWIDECGPNPSMIATDGKGNWLANTLNLTHGEWNGWLWWTPLPFVTAHDEDGDEEHDGRGRGFIPVPSRN